MQIPTNSWNNKPHANALNITKFAIEETQSQKINN